MPTFLRLRSSFLYVLAEIFIGKRKISKEVEEKLGSCEKIYAGDLKRHYKFIKGLMAMAPACMVLGGSMLW